MEYVFFSGGFDSSAFLLECIIVKKVETTPIVITDPHLDDKINKRYGRQNHRFEEIARNNIYNFINKLDDEYKKLLQDEIIIDEVILKEPMLSVGKRGYENKIFGRSAKQIHCFNQVMTDLNINGNILGTRNDGGTTNEAINYANPDGTINKDLLPDHAKFLEPFKVPYLHQTKEEIWERAVKYGYDEPLYDTWTCFFPKGERACGSCGPCKGRIIPNGMEYQLEFELNDNPSLL